jgi:hypothetical protein
MSYEISVLGADPEWDWSVWQSLHVRAICSMTFGTEE